MRQTKTNQMMKRLTMMAVLIMGLIFVNSSSTLAQGKCPDTLNEADWKKCWIKEAKSGNKNLQGASLSNANLKNIDLSNADLTDAQIANANLSGANLSGANLTRANLGNTNFTDANFKGANLSDAGLGLAILTNADFNGANMNGISFPLGAKIGGAKIDLTLLQCKVTTNGEDLNNEGSDGKVYGKLKNGTIVYKNGNNQSWDNGRMSVNEKQGDELVDIGLVDGKSLNCNTPTKLNTTKVTQCTVVTRGANLNARTLAGKLKFKIENNTEVYVFERSKDGRAKVSLFNDDNDEFKGWVSVEYLSCSAH